MRTLLPFYGRAKETSDAALYLFGVWAAAGLYAGWAPLVAFMEQPFYLESPTPAHAASVGLLLLATSVTVAMMPMWRVLRADPLLALRHD